MANQDEITFRLPQDAAREALHWIYNHLEDMTIDQEDDPRGADRAEYIAMARAFNVMAAAYREQFDDLPIRNFWPEDPDQLPDQ